MDKLSRINEAPKNIDNIFGLLFESSTEGLVVIDHKGEILMANPRMEELFGYDLTELIGSGVETLIPESKKAAHSTYREQYNQSPSRRLMGAGLDLIGLRKDGSDIPLEISLNHIGVGPDMLIMALITDISERKKAKDALEDMNTVLEERVRARTQQLDEAIQALQFSNKELQHEVAARQTAEKKIKDSLLKEQQLNELKSRFVSMASHEFRTPLSTILSSISLIDKYKDLGDHDKQGKHISRVKSSVHNLTQILNDFLSMDKLEAGKMNSNITTIGMTEFMNEMAEEIEMMTKAGQSVEFELSDFSFSCDIHILKNIMYNLLSNAVKYSPENSCIKVKVKNNNDHFTISVLDQGIGIPEEEQKMMFERFFRASNSVNIQGTGLGLNIVKKYLELLNGNISFKSTVDVGTEFTIMLPINQNKDD